MKAVEKISAKEVFNIETDISVSALSERSAEVPEIDEFIYGADPDNSKFSII